MFSLNQKFLRPSYFEKIGTTGRTDGRTDRETGRRGTTLDAGSREGGIIIKKTRRFGVSRSHNTVVSELFMKRIHHSDKVSNNGQASTYTKSEGTMDKI